MKLPGSEVPAPADFDAEHLAAFGEVMAQVAKKFRPNGASPDVVEIYVRNLVRMRRAEAHISEHGVLVKAPRTGNPIENPHLKIVDKCAGIIVKCARSLGIG